MMKQKLRMLLVEDNPINQRLIDFTLRKDFEITIANNGQEAVGLFSVDRFDVVLMDIMMPVMDGYEATEKIREIEKSGDTQRRTPIVALTGNSMDNDRQKCLATGMDEYLTKPLILETFHQTLINLGVHPDLKHSGLG